MALLSVACADERVDFRRDIQPVLARNCFPCHGPDDAQRQADLRLDVRNSAIEMASIVPGEPGESELVRRILSPDADERMPPAESKAALTGDQKELLVRWIKQGAVYKRHWAFVPPRRPRVPSVTDNGWSHNPIDHFILARMQKAGITRSPEADRYTLVRRVYLDLIGLPPTRKETDAFVADKDPAAYEQLVDRLLQSEHYGERWARKWLDLARYSDTNGYEKDRPRSIWPYRDWVIGALNDDMPFDQFSIEQLAGDLLPDATIDQRIATGFHRNTMLNEEGGIDPLEYRFHAMVDRVGTTGIVWLGLTTGCAQCHSHKYDPISHTDYYRLMALLNNADEPDLIVPDQAVADRRQEIEGRIARLESQLSDHFPPTEGDEQIELRRRANLARKFADWLQEAAADVVPWKVLRPLRLTSNLPKLERLIDDSVFSSGDITKRDTYAMTFRIDHISQPLTALRLEVLPDPRLPAGGPGRAYYEGRKGDFFLSEVTAEADGQPVKFSAASHSYGKISIGSGHAEAQNVIDGEASTGWSTSAREGQRHQLVLSIARPLIARELGFKLLFERHFAASLGRFRVSATTATGKVEATEIPLEIEALLLRQSTEPTHKFPGRWPSKAVDDRHVARATASEGQRTEDSRSRSATPAASGDLCVRATAWSPTDRAQLKRFFLRVSADLAESRQPIDHLRQQLPPYTTTMVMQERAADNPRQTFRHHRGEYLSPREQVSAGVPEIFPQLVACAPANRLALAKWLVSQRNPLVGRVTVNRAWRAFMGYGLMRTSGDFGTQSKPPTHPALLDWLACEFVDQGWSCKKLHRLIVTSATYRQQSTITPELMRRDSANRYFARGPRVRVDAEMVRDLLLHASGLLSPKVGGPSVYPPQPASVTALAYGGTKWQPSLGEDRYRRSLYTFSKRTAPFAAYTVFDGPTGENCMPRREHSNTPLQALTLLNDEMFLEMARALARDVLTRNAEPEEKTATTFFRRLLTRRPQPAELALIVAFRQSQLERFYNRELTASEVAGHDGGTAEFASWVMVARAIMNLDETITNK